MKEVCRVDFRTRVRPELDAEHRLGASIGVESSTRLEKEDPHRGHIEDRLEPPTFGLDLLEEAFAFSLGGHAHGDVAKHYREEHLAFDLDLRGRPLRRKLFAALSDSDQRRMVF